MRYVFTRAALAALALGLFASSVNAGTLTLAWDPSDGYVAGYQILYGLATGNYTYSADVGNRTTWQVFSLPAGVRVYFVVRAYDSFGRYSEFSNEVSAVVLGVTLTSDLTAPSPSGKPITFTAFASEGTNVEYRFFRFSQAQGAWTTVQNYSSANAFTWTPNSLEQGNYAVQVWSRVVGSTDSFQAYQTTGIFTVSDAPLTVGSLETDTALPVSTGTAMTWTAVADGGPAPLQYRFYRVREGGSWTMVQDYGASNAYTWTPGPSDEGRWALQVWVRRATSSAAFDAYRGSGFFEVRNGPPAVATLTANVPLPAGTGQPITWRATAAGGAGPLEFRFWRVSQSTGVWTSVQNYSTSPTYTWTPTSAEQGTYALQVWVRRQGSTASYEAYLASGYFQISNAAPALTTVTADRPAPYGVNAPITWKASATGGPGPLQYRFWLYDQRNDSWGILQDYSPNRTFTWTPQQGGTFSLLVGVRRPGSSARFDAYVATSFFSVGATAPAVESVKADVGTDAVVGTPISWTAIAGGGSGRLEYRFWRLNHATGVWTSVQDYSWDETFEWVPLSGEQGTYTLQAWVRRTGSMASWEAYSASSTFTVR